MDVESYNASRARNCHAQRCLERPIVCCCPACCDLETRRTRKFEAAPVCNINSKLQASATSFGPFTCSELSLVRKPSQEILQEVLAPVLAEV